jgi:hypothetical protein
MNEVLVNHLGLIVSGVLGLSLLLEAFHLHLRVVQFGVGIDHFVFVSEKLEAFSKTLLSTMPLGERTHQLGVVNDKDRGNTLRFEILPNEFVNQARSGAWESAFNTSFSAKLVEKFACLLSFKVTTSG